MTLTVGPSGAGKCTWSAAQGIEVISSDEIRRERSQDGEVRGAQSEIFHEVRMRSAKVLSNGRSVIVDAMHIEADDRLRQVAIAPADVPKKYALIDRPLADKQRDGGLERTQRSGRQVSPPVRRTRGRCVGGRRSRRRRGHRSPGAARPRKCRLALASPVPPFGELIPKVVMGLA
ncbi:AAA family ATPase [Bradyrhizobium yuanmingense]|uniref:AAA family ATPase n=1 Tax=Bradyrhizobium yuanmingense TaxID=108015 RepID=UPI003518B441